MSWQMIVVNVASGLVGGYLLNLYGAALIRYLRRFSRRHDAAVAAKALEEATMENERVAALVAEWRAGGFSDRHYGAHAYMAKVAGLYREETE